MKNLRDDGTPVPEYIGEPEVKRSLMDVYQIASNFYEYGSIRDELVVKEILLEVIDECLKGLGVRKR